MNDRDERMEKLMTHPFDYENTLQGKKLVLSYSFETGIRKSVCQVLRISSGFWKDHRIEIAYHKDRYAYHIEVHDSCFLFYE